LASAATVVVFLAAIVTPSSSTAGSLAAVSSPPPAPAPFVLPTRPATPDRPLPVHLRPPLSQAAADYPQSYLDRCHVGVDQKMTGASCLYGNLYSATTIALFGDSHALGWFPAMLGVAQRHAWRLLDMTMSACSPAQINEWLPDQRRISTACTTWRRQALTRIAAAKPTLIVISGTRGFAAADSAGHVLNGAARTAAWETGMLATLGRLKAMGRVALLADTPIAGTDPLTCLPLHPQSLNACATPVGTAISATWLAEEQHVATMAGVGFIDPELWICPSAPCPVVIGNILVLRNAGHLTATFASTLGTKLDKALAALP
jgi:hypothetical protein